MRILPALSYPVLVVLLLVTCEGKATRPEQTPVETPVERPAYGFIHRALTYTVETDSTGTSQFKRSPTLLDLGESLTSLGSTMEGVVEGGPDRMALIRTEDGSEVWVRERYIVVGGSLGVVTMDKAVLYSKPRETSPTPNTLDRGSILAIFPEEHQGFTKISGWDRRTVFDAQFLKNEAISRRDEDVQAAMLLYLAGVSENEIVKAELLKSASAYTDSVFIRDVDLALGKESPPPARTVPPQRLAQTEAIVAELGSRPSESFQSLAAISADGVNIRNLPIQTGSETLTRLGLGEPIVVVARTRERFRVGDKTSHWYRISKPLDGWVFGGFVELP